MYVACFYINYMKVVSELAVGLVKFVVPLIQEELRLGGNSRGGKNQFRCVPDIKDDPRNVSVTYRSLLVIMKEVAAVLGWLVIPLQAIFGKMAVYSIYILIRHPPDHVTCLIILVCIPFMVLTWVTVLKSAGRLGRVSKTCVASWKIKSHLWTSSEDRKYMVKFMKSCKPLSFGCPGFMTITQVTVLKFLQGIATGIFRLLLTLRKD